MDEIVENGTNLPSENSTQVAEVGISLDRLLSAYYEIQSEESVPYMLAYLLSTAHDSMGTAINISNDVNDLQGKNRISASNLDDTFRNIALDDLSYVKTDMILELYVEALNLFLEDKQQLPTKTRAANALLYKLKTFFILLIKNEQHVIISKLNVPDFMEIYIDEANSYLDEKAKEIYEDFISYVEQTESQYLADYFRSLGSNIWGSHRSNMREVYNKITKPVMDHIKDWTKLRDRVLELRNDYFHVTRSINYNKLYGIFQIGKTTFEDYRKELIPELDALFESLSDSLNLRDLLI
jgi:DNA-binding ferritin-like protein (Dps family)